MKVNTTPIIDAVEAIEEVIAVPQLPGTIIGMVAHEGSQMLDEESDEAAVSWLKDLSNGKPWIRLEAVGSASTYLGSGVVLKVLACAPFSSTLLVREHLMPQVAIATDVVLRIVQPDRCNNATRTSSRSHLGEVGRCA